MNPDMTLQEDMRLCLRYRLHELPSAQHKAGLAGFVFLCDSFTRRGFSGGIECTMLTADEAEFLFDAKQLRVTFEDLYAAEPWELKSKSKFSGSKEPVRIDERLVEGGADGKTEKVFVYDSFRPTCPALAALLSGGKDGRWLKLWRDMLWAVLRAQPTTRGDFETLAKGGAWPMPDKLWEALLKAHKARAKGRMVTESVAGSLFVGAQASNAERVNFQGSVELNLLLHFWQLVTPVFAPRAIDLKARRLTDQGYLLAIPEVSDLAEFQDEIVKYWQSRSEEIRGYRPEQAVIDVPLEGGLELLHDLASQRTAGALGFSVGAIEWSHQEKQGNSVRIHAQGRLPASRRLLKRYLELRDRRADPLFKRLLITNLLADQPWYRGAAALLAPYPSEFFIHSVKTPGFSHFGADARRRFKTLISELKAQEKNAMTDIDDTDFDAALARRVYDLTGAYVLRRAEDRSGMKRAKFSSDAQGKLIYPGDYRDAIEKVAKDAFIAMRGRNEREFVSYFTGAICAVPQFFAGPDDFVAVSRALVTKPEHVKDLAMLALSAHAWRGGKRSDHTKEQDSPSADDVAA